MKIIRDGVEIELTKEELYTAWEEEQEYFDTESILARIDETDKGLFPDQDAIDRFVEAALYCYNKNRDYGCDEEWSFDDAISETLSELANQNTIS